MEPSEPKIAEPERIEHEISVRYRHRIRFTQGAFHPENPLLRELLGEDRPARPPKVLVTLDAGVAEACPGLTDQIRAYFATGRPAARLVAPPLILPGGEAAKDGLTQVRTVQEAIYRHHLCRHSYVVAVGGGAHLDAVGFAAATAHRGVRLVRLPTTVLAQADSGVGVKNSVNLFGAKNFLGSFAPPFAVINDADFLRVLPLREQRAGFSEAVKVALIRDGAFFAELERQADVLARFDPVAIERLVRRCARLHVEHIATSGDPFELGSARPLDFGHWAAHKLETLSRHRLRHGEAVAIGVALDTLYSVRCGRLARAEGERVLSLLTRLGFTLWAPELAWTDATGRLQLLDGLEEFREHLGGELTVTLLDALGRGVEVHALDPSLIAQSLAELKARASPGGAIA